MCERGLFIEVEAYSKSAEESYLKTSLFLGFSHDIQS